MNILAVDAAGAELSVALQTRTRVFRARRSAQTPHDESLLPAVESLLKRAGLRWEDLDAVAAAAGPGRFTGIRIGLAFAAMAGSQLKIPALALSRLEAAAEGAGAERVLAALPGWKGEVSYQAFRRGKARLVAAGGAEWVSAQDWPAVRAAAEKRGTFVAYGETGAADLLAVARRRLVAGKIPPLAPFYLKPAGYERSRG